MTTKIKPLPPLAELHRLFEVRDGLLIRRTAQGGVKPGTVAGTPILRGGHISVSIGDTRYLAHRLIWALCKGEDPAPYQIDHINGNRTDNRIENLRKVTHQQNGMNRCKAQRNSRSGVVGVYPHKATGKWEASITYNGKSMFLGLHETKEAALAIRVAKEQELFGKHAPNRERGD
jgi:hypothetical protein